MTWAIYGATGYTGRLIVIEALGRGHRPLLLGRSADTLRPVAESLGLEYLAAPNAGALATALHGVEVVVNVAGPFNRTVDMVTEACLASSTSYLDISNELGTVQSVLDRYEQFVAAGAMAVPAVGFGTVATEAAASRASAQVADTVTVEVALLADNAGGGAGTAASVFSVLAEGGVRIVDGAAVRSRLGRGISRVRTPLGWRSLIPIAAGDLATVRITTGAASITASVAFAVPRALLAVGLPVVSRVARTGLLRPRAATVGAPRQHRSYAWARGTDAAGATATAWLATGEGYAFTASSVVLAVERVLSAAKPGAYSSGTAFSGDFALRVPGTRVDLLDNFGAVVASP